MLVSLVNKGTSAPIEIDKCSIVYQGPSKKARIFIYFQDAKTDIGRIEMTAQEFRKFAYLGTQVLTDNKVPDNG